jgi:protein involved in polysaccharide export with SLBB domain
VRFRRAVGLPLPPLLVLLLAADAARGQSNTGVLDLLGSSVQGRNVTAPSAAPVVPPMGGPIDPAEYVLGPGDALQIVVSGGVTRAWDLMVLPEGTLYVPSVGSIPLAGLTLVEARREVLKRVSAEYKSVTLELRLLRPRTLLVVLAGETTRPGPLEVIASSRASELLSEALLGPHATHRNIELRRRSPKGETTIRIDLTRLRLTGHMPNDPLLREGDVIYFPIYSHGVSISGAVGRADRYELAPGDSLGTLLEMAGGPVVNAADEATLVRFRDITSSDSTRFKVSDVLAGRFDPPLQDGDHVFVYYQPRYHELDQATVFGEVGRPGVYPLTPGGMRLSELVKAAGGFLPTADLASLRIFRASSIATDPDPELERLGKLSRKEMTASEYEVLRARLTARRENFRVDWNRAKTRPELDIAVRTGDVVRVDRVAAAVLVDGEVRQPGLVHFVQGRRVNDYVRLAGGYSKRASRNEVRVKRAGSGQTILARENTGIEPGDLVWVPERGETANWQHLQSLLLLLAQIATVIVAVRK